jgi:copper chaperone CopZ
MRRLVLIIIVSAVVILGVALFVSWRRAPTYVEGSQSTADTKTVVIPVEGMVCASCTASVKRKLQSIDGVTEVEVSLERRETRVRYREGKTSPERLAAAINEVGFKAGAPAEQR